MPKTVIRNRGSAIFRIIFGFCFICLGAYRHFQEGAAPEAGLFTGIIGLLFFGYGLYALVAGNTVEIQSSGTPSTPTERLGEILQMKTNGLITEAEYEQKRQEILGNL